MTTEALDSASGDESADDGADRTHRDQQAVADVADADDVLGVEHQDRFAGGVQTGEDAEEQGEGAELGVLPQPAQADLDAGQDPPRWSGAGGPVATADERNAHGRGGEGGGVEDERERQADRGQDTAEWWADEPVRDGLERGQSPVGPLQPLRCDEGWHDDLGGVVAEGLADAEQHTDRTQRGHRCPVGGDEGGERDERDGRRTSVRQISWRRSTRSATSPASNEHASQGSRIGSKTAAIAVGSRVRSVASSGNATRNTPSPTFETVEAVTSLANACRSTDVTAVVTVGARVGGARSARSGRSPTSPRTRCRHGPIPPPGLPTG